MKKFFYCLFSICHVFIQDLLKKHFIMPAQAVWRFLDTMLPEKILLPEAWG